jgi:hypothetical protein
MHRYLPASTVASPASRGRKQLAVTGVGRKNLIEDIMRLADKRDEGLRAQVFGQDLLQMALIEYQHVVEALGPDRSHPALGDRRWPGAI